MRKQAVLTVFAALWRPEDTNAFVASSEFAAWNEKFQSLVTDFKFSHITLEPGSVKPFEDPVTEISTVSGVNAQYPAVAKRFLQLCEEDKPAGFLHSALGEVFNPAEDAERIVQYVVGWTSLEDHLNAKGKSPGRNEIKKELSSSGTKPETVSYTVDPKTLRKQNCH